MADPIVYKVSPIKETEFNPEQDRYAFFYSGAFKEIFGKKQKHYGKEGYVKITTGKESVYLRFRALNGIKKDEVKLSYLNCSILNAVVPKDQEPTFVSIKKVNSLCYNWNNSDLDARHDFRWAFSGFCALIAFDIPQFAYFIYHLFN